MKIDRRISRVLEGGDHSTDQNEYKRKSIYYKKRQVEIKMKQTSIVDNSMGDKQQICENLCQNWLTT